MPLDCRAPFKAVRLNYDGSLKVCAKFSIGSINENRSLLDIWHGARATQIRASFPKRPAICTTCDYYRLCVNAVNIDYTKPENIVVPSSPDPATIVNIEGYRILRWLEKFYLLPPGTPDFDPRFDDVTPERRVVEFKNFPQMRALINSLLTQLGQKPVPINIPTHEIWYFGNGFFAIPRTDDKGLEVVVETSPERLITRLTGKQPALAAG
jgi:radical SAM protein with 4Fe4S-binding SPASM domain